MTTTCQLCARNIKLVSGLIAYHGYYKDRDGSWKTGSCRGSREKPYEISRDAIPTALTRYKTYARRLEETKRRLETGTLPVPVYRMGRQIDEKQPGEDGYSSALRSEIVKWKDAIHFLNRDIEALQKRFDNWKMVGVKAQ